MNPIASLTMPTVARDAGSSGATQKSVAQVQSVTNTSVVPQGPVLMATAVASVGGADPAARTSLKPVQSDDPETSERSQDTDRIETAAKMPETGVRPAAPLRSFAQIPTEMVQEIIRIRENKASDSAKGIDGRQDPTPMPARSDAIGPAAEDSPQPA